MLQTITQQASVESTYSSAQELANGLKALNTMPLWTQMKKLNPPLPNPTCVPHVWKYGDIRPSLLAAGELVTEKEAERRVLMLVNPARGKYVGPVPGTKLTLLRSTVHNRHHLWWPSTCDAW